MPIYVLGFAEAPLFASLIVVSAQATFIHANVCFECGPLKWLIATPQFHHGHHADEAEAIDKNFAVHLPAIDAIFGTMYLPRRWPRGYGIAEGAPYPMAISGSWPGRSPHRGDADPGPAVRDSGTV